MTLIEDVSIFLGILGIVIALSLSYYHFYSDHKRRINDEKFFVVQIKDNLRQMSQYFLDVENVSTYNEQFDDDASADLVNDFYLRKLQEMKDLLYQTKLYLPFWKTLSPSDKSTVNALLNEFSWLLYDFYPLHLPKSIRKINLINSQKLFHTKKENVMENTHGLLQKY